MDPTLADTNVQENQGVIGEVADECTGEPSQHGSSWNVDLESSSQPVSTSTDTPSMVLFTSHYKLARSHLAAFVALACLSLSHRRHRRR
jgi:hypothetical protein